MSRLESACRRLTAQIACLNFAAAQIAGLPGPVFELGLGNGRTYDHLRERLPDRDIFVFERTLAAHQASCPPKEYLFCGDFRDSLPTCATRFAGRVALIHGDVGAGDVAGDAALARFLADTLRPFMAPGGLVVCDQDLGPDFAPRHPLPQNIPRDRYFIYGF